MLLPKLLQTCCVPCRAAHEPHRAAPGAASAAGACGARRTRRGAAAAAGAHQRQHCFDRGAHGVCGGSGQRCVSLVDCCAAACGCLPICHADSTSWMGYAPAQSAPPAARQVLVGCWRSVKPEPPPEAMTKKVCGLGGPGGWGLLHVPLQVPCRARRPRTCSEPPRMCAPHYLWVVA